MTALIKKFYSNPKYSKGLEWGRLITITGFAQAMVQAVGILSGIIIIRLLPTHEYALYTLVNTMLGTLTLLADGGVSTGVMAQGTKVWQNKEKLGAVIVTGLELRRTFSIYSLLVAIPTLFYLLHHHGASWLLSFIIVLSLIPAFLAALSDSLLEVSPKLHQDIGNLQKNQVSTSLVRLLLISFSVFIFPFTFVALIGNGLSRIWGNIRLRKISANYADSSQKADKVVRDEILKIVKRTLPGIIYYCLSGQITVWLISIFGSTHAVAQVGALGRLAAMLTIFGSLLSTLIIPRFARLANNSKLLLSRFLQILIIVAFLCVIIVMAVNFFGNNILWVLGTNYSGLNNFLVLNIIGSCINLIVGVSFSLYSSRGWVIHPLFSIPYDILVIILGIFLFNISTLEGIFELNIFVGVMQLLMHVIFPVIKILRSN